MEIVKLREGEDYIKLGQLLKKAGMVSSGVEAKIMIADGLVDVNHQVETQRGKKLRDGDEVTFQNETVKVEK